MIDIILIAVFVLIVALAVKKGFILTVFDLFSGIAAFIGARFIAPPVASAIYESKVRNIVIEFLTEKYKGAENTIAQSLGSVTEAFDFLPDGVYSYIENAGLLDTQAMSQSILSSITTVERLEADIVGPVVLAVVNLICFAVLAFILLIVLRIAGRLLSKLISVTKLGKNLNKTLGGITGVLKGVVYVFIIATILSVVSLASESVAEYTASSYICSVARTLIGI